MISRGGLYLFSLWTAQMEGAAPMPPVGYSMPSSVYLSWSGTVLDRKGAGGLTAWVNGEYCAQIRTLRRSRQACYAMTLTVPCGHLLRSHTDVPLCDILMSVSMRPCPPKNLPESGPSRHAPFGSHRQPGCQPLPSSWYHHVFHPPVYGIPFFRSLFFIPPRLS